MPTTYPPRRPSQGNLNKADTCRVHITLALVCRGWGDPPWRIKEQHYFTDGQIILVGSDHRRQRSKKADYLLRYQESFPIAVVEAKAEAGKIAVRYDPSPRRRHTAKSVTRGTMRAAKCAKISHFGGLVARV